MVYMIKLTTGGKVVVWAVDVALVVAVEPGACAASVPAHLGPPSVPESAPTGSESFTSVLPPSSSAFSPSSAVWPPLLVASELPAPVASPEDRCRIADVALSNIEDTYWDYVAKCDIDKVIDRTSKVRCESAKSVSAHHLENACPHCLGMLAFCQLHTCDPSDTRPDLVQFVCERARNALPSAYGHLVLGLVFSVVAGLRSLPADDRVVFLERSIFHLRHCDQLHIGCLYLGHACANLGLREDAFNAFTKGSKLGLKVLCLMESGECYRTGFGVEQDRQVGQRIGNEVAQHSATLKLVFFKDWEKNVKSGENLVEFFKKWVKDGPSGETPTGLWLYPVCYMSHSVTCCLQLWRNQLCSSPKPKPRSGRVI